MGGEDEGKAASSSRVGCFSLGVRQPKKKKRKEKDKLSGKAS